MTTLEPERVTVTIASSAGEDAPLTVEDAMRQLLDIFQLLDAAGEEDAQSIVWQLVDISINSPLRATARAVPRFAGVDAAIVARKEKVRVAHSFRQILRTSRAPEWMARDDLARARSIFNRNSQSIGRTNIDFHLPSEPPEVISHREAFTGVTAIDLIEKERAHNEAFAAARSLPWSEIGTLEGSVVSIKTHYGNPAIVVRERLTGREVTCVAAPGAIEDAGKHTWAETWENKRVLVSGEIFYSPSGAVMRVASAEFELVEPPRLTYRQIADPTFTGGLSPSDYLSKLWDDDIGG